MAGNRNRSVPPGGIRFKRYDRRPAARFAAGLLRLRKRLVDLLEIDAVVDEKPLILRRPQVANLLSRHLRERPEGSYVAALAEAGVARAAQKLGEEAVEAALAASTGDGTLAAEAADVLFHLYVLLAIAGVDIEEVEQELVSRRR